MDRTEGEGLVRLAAVLLVGLCCATIPHTAWGQLVFQHVGSAAPTDEGWTLGGNPAYAGPVADDFGEEAWFAADTSAAPPNSNTAGYYRLLDPDQLAQASSGAWSLTTRLRIDGFPNGSVMVLFRQTAYLDWAMHFGSDAAGRPIVWLKTGATSGPQYTVPDPSGGYHTYELRYVPGAGASLHVDQDPVPVLSGYSCSCPTSPSGVHGGLARWSIAIR